MTEPPTDPRTRATQVGKVFGYAIGITLGLVLLAAGIGILVLVVRAIGWLLV